jgi:hypothetical protein
LAGRAPKIGFNLVNVTRVSTQDWKWRDIDEAPFLV